MLSQIFTLGHRLTKRFILVSTEISSIILCDMCFIGSFKPVRFSISTKLSNDAFSLSLILTLRYVLPILGSPQAREFLA